MKQIKFFLFFLILPALSGSGKASAQSIYWADGTHQFARKIAGTLYEPVPPGVISYETKDGKFVEIWDNNMAGGILKGYVKTANERTEYYGPNNNEVGYFINAGGALRYYGTTATGSVIEKEALAATVYDGIIYDHNGDIRFKVDTDFDPVVLGFFLLCY